MSKIDLAAQLRANIARGPHYEADCEESPAPAHPLVRLIAFYLPQFHPIPENDRWWGPGFTEWTNVTKAQPLFPGHYQPHLPEGLGFYDLRLPEALRAQAATAKKYGIHGFCFYYYWFGGKRLLEKPLEILLSDPTIDLPFCVCWANENWTRRWDGFEKDVLIGQDHSPEDDIAFAKSLEPIIRDPRYIRVRDRPLIMVYQPLLLPNPVATARRWRAHFARAGLGDPLLVMAQRFSEEDPRVLAFDAAVEHPPHKVGFPGPRIDSAIRFFQENYRARVHRYDDMVDCALAQPPAPFQLFRGVCPGWDNVARVPNGGTVFASPSPDGYARWLDDACRSALLSAEPSERLVFINAWNEWAEGCHLEPDRHFGYAYLRATALTLARLSTRVTRLEAKRIAVVSHDAYLHGAQLLALHIVRALVEKFGADVRVLLGGPGPLEQDFRRHAPTEQVAGGFADRENWLIVARRLKEEGFSTVICNTTVSAQAVEPLKAAGLHVVLLVHELPMIIEEKGLLDGARTAARLADAVVFPALSVRDSFVAMAGPVAGECIVRPQGLFTPPLAGAARQEKRAAVRRSLNADANDLVVLGAGYGDLRKGLDLWPELIRRVSVRCPHALFVWVGHTDGAVRARVEAELERLSLARRFRFIAATKSAQDFFAAADVFLLTSREDPFPNVVLEAMANGLPVAAFDEVGGFAELVRQTGASLAPRFDLAAMANALCDYLGDEALRRRIGALSQQRIENEFDFQAYVADLLHFAAGARPTVSVIVPNYNYGRHLAQRLESIWWQTYPLHEIIVLDDASSDDSEQILARLEQAGTPPLRIVRNETNSGSAWHQWAKGVSLASGELVWIAEADDFADPDFLAATVPAFMDSRVMLSYCQSRQVDEAGRLTAPDYLEWVADVDPELWRSDYCRPGTIEIAEALSVKNTIPNVSAVVFRKQALARVLDAHLDEMIACRNVGDWRCYIRLLADGCVAFTAGSHNNHRRHARGVTLAARDRRHWQEIAATQDFAASVVAVSDAKRAAARRFREQTARQFGAENQPDEAAVVAPHGGK